MRRCRVRDMGALGGLVDVAPHACGVILADPAARGRDFYFLMLCLFKHRVFLLLRRLVLWHVRRATELAFKEAPGGPLRAAHGTVEQP